MVGAAARIYSWNGERTRFERQLRKDLLLTDHALAFYGQSAPAPAE